MSDSKAIVPASNAARVSVYRSQADFETGQRLAKALCSSRFMPESFRNVADALAVIDMANAMQISPAHLARNLYDVHGKPGISSSLLVGVINKSKQFSRVRYKWHGEPGKPSWGCQAYARDLELGEDVYGSIVTMQMAHDEGWSRDKTDRKGSVIKSKWNTMPMHMLMLRAGAFFAREMAPELLFGMHSSIELEDIPEAEWCSGEEEVVDEPSDTIPAPPAPTEENASLVDEIMA